MWRGGRVGRSVTRTSPLEGGDVGSHNSVAHDALLIEGEPWLLLISESKGVEREPKYRNRTDEETPLKIQYDTRWTKSGHC